LDITNYSSTLIFFQWKAPDDVVYYQAKNPMKRVAESYAEQRAQRKRFRTGSTSGTKGNVGGCSSTESERAFEEIDSLLSRTYELSLNIPTTQDSTSKASSLGSEEIRTAEDQFLHHLQQTTYHLRESYKNFKTINQEKRKEAQQNKQMIVNNTSGTVQNLLYFSIVFMMI